LSRFALLRGVLLGLLRNGEDEVGDVAFDLQRLFKIAVLVSDLLAGDVHASGHRDLLVLSVAGVLDAKRVGALGHAIEMKGALAVELPVGDAFLVPRVFDVISPLLMTWPLLAAVTTPLTE